ncbi:MbcA/ParS/Xre antitoxin family protein [Pectobacterium carotovorum]|uniref:MbcA/ParS/Xre antitoxin family protein n=1 Tax=Pectobacterium carotovorum TaxID=554 RepID=UPI0009B7EF95|nr:MbcA/ParS/Xre antitoxin family protein [Pectobacterium carotovorum]
MENHPMCFSGRFFIGTPDGAKIYFWAVRGWPQATILTMHDVTSLKKMTPVQRKTYEMSQLKKSFDTAIYSSTLRVPVVSGRAIELFEGDGALAEKWLSEPNRALGWKTPAEILSSQSGIDEVLRLITCIEQGVYP